MTWIVVRILIREPAIHRRRARHVYARGLRWKADLFSALVYARKVLAGGHVGVWVEGEGAPATSLRRHFGRVPTPRRRVEQ
jgi:hypothetical protein